MCFAFTVLVFRAALSAWAALHLRAGLISGRTAAALALGTEPSVALDQGSDPLPFRSAPLPQVELIRDFSGTLPSLGH